MALGRKFLAALGIEGDKVDEIINAHTETVDGLKEEIAKYKADAEELPKVKAELASLKEASDKAGKDGNAYKVKYEAIKEEFETYKKDVEAKETKATKESAYRELLKDAGISEKHIEKILKVSDGDIEKLELDVDGKVKGSADIVKGISEEWEDFIVKESKAGAQTSTPPANVGGNKLSKDEIFAIKDTAQRQAAMLENKDLFLN